MAQRSNLAEFVSDLAHDLASARRWDSGPISARIQSSLSAALQVVDGSHPDARHDLAGGGGDGVAPLPVGSPGLAVVHSAVGGGGM